MGAKYSCWQSVDDTCSRIRRGLQFWRKTESHDAIYADLFLVANPKAVVEAIHSTVFRFGTPVSASFILHWFHGLETHNLYSVTSGLFLENDAMLDANDTVLLVPNAKHAASDKRELHGSAKYAYGRKLLEYSRPMAQTVSTPNQHKIDVSTGRHVVLGLTGTAVDAECARNLAPKHGLRYDRLDSNYADTPGLYFRVPISMRKFFIRPSLPAFFAQIRAERAHLHIVTDCDRKLARAIASLLSRLLSVNIDSVLSDEDMLDLGCRPNEKDFSAIFQGYDRSCSSLLIVDENTNRLGDQSWINVPDPVLLCEVPPFEYSESPEQLPPILQSIHDHYISHKEAHLLSHETTTLPSHVNTPCASDPVLFVADEGLWTQQKDPSAILLDCAKCGWVVNTLGMCAAMRQGDKAHALRSSHYERRTCWRCDGWSSPTLEERMTVEALTSASYKRRPKKERAHKCRKMAKLEVIAEACEEDYEREEGEKEGQREAEREREA